MAFGALHFFPGVGDVFRMTEFEAVQILLQFRNPVVRSLGNDHVARGAPVRNHIALGILHLIVVAAKTTVIDEMTQMIFPRPVIGFHLREEVLAVYHPQLFGGLVDFARRQRRQISILTLVEGA